MNDSLILKDSCKLKSGAWKKKKKSEAWGENLYGEILMAETRSNKKKKSF